MILRVPTTAPPEHGDNVHADISKKVIDNAKATARAVVDGLSLVAEFTEGVPYLGSISKALTAFEAVLDVSPRYIV